MSPYSAMGGNPISQIDPEGDFPFLALGIGALVGVFSNGLSNISNGQGFFKGAVKAGIWGAVGAGASFGIGSVFGATGSFGHELLRAGVHGLSSGIQSELQGGSFLQGALSGGISSGIGSGIDALGGDAGHQIFGGAVGGGIGAAISGGDFFQGFGQGFAVGAFNYALHSGFQGGPRDPKVIKTEKQGSSTIYYYDDGSIATWGPGGSLWVTAPNGQSRQVLMASGTIQSTAAPWEYFMGGSFLKDGFKIVGTKLISQRWFRKNVFNKFPSEKGWGIQIGKFIRYHNHHTIYHGPHRQIDINWFGSWKSIRIPRGR